jgi:sulfoxide reductase heme-binding subunit YedZ
LGITSATAIRKKMGKRWRQLHKLTYIVVILGWLHLLWLSRSDVGDAVLYGVIFGLLLGYRVRKSMRSRASLLSLGSG